MRSRLFFIIQAIEDHCLSSGLGTSEGSSGGHIATSCTLHCVIVVFSFLNNIWAAFRRELVV